MNHLFRKIKLLKENAPVLLLIIFFILMIFIFSPRLNSDGAYYYEFVRSWIFDGGMNFQNERDFHTYKYVPILNFIPGDWEQTGYARNIFSFGPPLIWAPFFFAVRLVDVFLFQKTGIIGPTNGYELSYRMVIGVLSLLQGYLTLLIMLKIADRFFHRRNSLISLFIIFTASHLPAFVFVTPAFSHALSLFMTTLFIYFWVLNLNKKVDRSLVFYGLWGVIGGIMIIARWQNAFTFILLAVDAFEHFRKKKLQDFPLFIARYIILAVFAGLCIIPQLTVTQTIYGRFITDPQGSGGMLWFRPRIKIVFLDSIKGLFVVNPIFIPATIGLLFFLKKKFKFGAGFLLLFLVQSYVNCVRRDWSGVGFGMRRFLNLMPIFYIGYCTLLEFLSKKKVIRWAFLGISILAVPWNMLLMAQYYFSKLGAPWIRMSFAEMFRNQFVLSPLLFKKLVESSLPFEILQGKYVHITGAFAVFLLPFIILIVCCRLFRKFESGELIFSKKLNLTILSIVSMFMLLSSAHLVFAYIDVRGLIAVDLGQTEPQKGTLVTLRADEPYHGSKNGLIFDGNEVYQYKTKAEYNPDVFLQLGEYVQDRKKIENVNVTPVKFELNVKRLFKGFQIVSRMNSASSNAASTIQPALLIVVVDSKNRRRKFQFNAYEHTFPDYQSFKERANSLHSKTKLAAVHKTGRNSNPYFAADFPFQDYIMPQEIQFYSLSNFHVNIEVTGFAFKIGVPPKVVREKGIVIPPIKK